MFPLKYGPYSPSRLETAFCPFSFYNQYVLKDLVSKVEDLPQARGSAVHEVFEKITKRFCDQPNCTFAESEIMDWVATAVAGHPAAQEEITDIIKMSRKYIKRPPRLLTSDSDIELKLAVKWSDTKNDFVECDYDDPDAFGRGRADIMVISDDTTTAVVYDHKTQMHIEEANTFQMGFYAWVISKIYPFLDTIRTVLHFAQYGKYSDPYTWTREELQRVQEEIIARVKVVESLTSWPSVAHSNSNCGYCRYNYKCGLFLECAEIADDGRAKSKLSNFEIHDTQKAVHAASLITVMEESSRKLRANLKKYVKTSGPVALTGKVFKFVPNEKIDWDKINKTMRRDVYELFNKYGIDPKTYMSFNQSTTPSVWLSVDNSEFLKELSELLPRKITSEFEGVTV